MVISKTPFRISFFGGGSDYPIWLDENNGSVISTTIDKYCYISIRELPPFFEHKYRIVYSKIENVKKINEISHPAIKGVLSWFNWKEYGLEIHHDGDLPARSGIGSSSAFTVGFINALKALQNRKINKSELAKNAIHVERNVIGENVGLQDQVATAYGGLNNITFKKNCKFKVEKINISRKRELQLQKSLLLFYVGLPRISSDIVKSHIVNIKKDNSTIRKICDIKNKALDVLIDENTSLETFGELLNESWIYKKNISNKVSNNIIDDIYNTGLKNGAIGGKVLGAGGGGFMIFFAPELKHKNIIKSLSNLIYVPFKFENEGSSIIFNNKK